MGYHLFLSYLLFPFPRALILLKETVILPVPQGEIFHFPLYLLIDLYISLVLASQQLLQGPGLGEFGSDRLVYFLDLFYRRRRVAPILVKDPTQLLKFTILILEEVKGPLQISLQVLGLSLPVYLLQGHGAMTIPSRAP